jgi:hypothetical protein
MAIAVVMELDGATLEQYDQVVERIGLTPGGPGADGGLFHWVTVTNNGLLITDVWQTQEAYEKFAAEQLGPHTQAAGIKGPPKTTFYDVHNYNTQGNAPARV